MENLKVTRMNFKQQREAYGIKVKDIADICNLSPLTVTNFEKSTGKYTQTNARDYNADMMCQTLESLISTKLDELFMKENEEKKKKELAAADNAMKNRMAFARQKQWEQGYPKKPIIENILRYLELNNLTKKEFCMMCNISITTFNQSDACKGNVILKRTVDKITKATGWTAEQLISGDFINNNMPLLTTESKKVEEHLKKAEERLNQQFICKNGKFYRQYDIQVIQHVEEEITAEEFMDAVKEEIGI